MLHKTIVDKKLRAYIKKHLGKGFSKDSVRKVLVDHGYEESYIQRLLLKHSETQFVKNYALAVLMAFIVSILSFDIIPTESQQKITGYAAAIEKEADANFPMIILALLSVISLISLFMFLNKRKRPHG